MTKYDHRLKRLEAKTGLKEKLFNYWIIISGKGKESTAKIIRNIKAGLIIGKMGLPFNPENKNLVIVSTIPRPMKAELRSRKAFPENEIPDLTDDELETEISRIQKELEK